MSGTGPEYASAADIDTALLELAHAAEALPHRIDRLTRSLLRLHNARALHHDRDVTGDALDDVVDAAAQLLGHASTQAQAAAARLHRARQITVHLAGSPS